MQQQQMQQQQQQQQRSSSRQGYRQQGMQGGIHGKGMGMASGGQQPPCVTVEQLVQAVAKLPPGETAVAAVSKGLTFLDSSAVAALLKELAKQGCLKQSVEIFDWLRSLPPTHELSRLCDLYTYTTMISQCGSHQQLSRALDLVTEMRAKGIPCNVHTYSALMNVCVKANDFQLAKDMFTRMAADGVQSNLVTFNILIDVHSKNGEWEEAVARLDDMERQGINAEVRTYNTVISACSKNSQPEKAMAIYERMLAAGVQPSATTYTVLISSYGKRGQVEKAMELYQDMIRRGCERNVITYSSLISACEKAGRFELAMELFAQMHVEGCRPNVVTYNSLIAVCAHGNGQWERAATLFDQMQREGCQPDNITYTQLLAAYERGGQWQRALQAVEMMPMHGCTADASAFNSLLEVLWQSGVLVAQARALQVWTVANKTGQCGMFIDTRSSPDAVQYSTAGGSRGAIIVAVLRWLAELHSKANASSEGFLRQRILLKVNKAKQARQLDLLSATQDALGVLFCGSGAPLKVTSVVNGLLISASGDQLYQWLLGPGLSDLVFMQQGLIRKKLPLQALVAHDAALAARCSAAFSGMRTSEGACAPSELMYDPVVLQQRTQVVDLALQYASSFQLQDGTIYDAIHLFDRVMCMHPPTVASEMWPLALGVCAALTATATSPPPAGVTSPSMMPSMDNLINSSQAAALMAAYPAETITSMERSVMVALGPQGVEGVDRGAGNSVAR